MSLFVSRKCPSCGKSSALDAIYMGLHCYACDCGACYAANLITEVAMHVLPFDGNVMCYVGCGYLKALWMYFTYPWQKDTPA